MENLSIHNEIEMKIDEFNKKIEDYKLELDELYKTKKEIIKIWGSDNVRIYELDDQSCTCHRCAEGRQNCAYNIKFVGTTDRNVILPNRVRSTSNDLEWYINDKKIDNNDLIIYGEDINEIYEQLYYEWRHPESK
jgi:hypothetical protein